MCDASLAALERLLMTPRHKFGPSHEWLANWNFPPPKAWAEAQRLAAERSNQNCADAPAYDYPELPEWVELGRRK